MLRAHLIAIILMLLCGPIYAQKVLHISTVTDSGAYAHISDMVVEAYHRLGYDVKISKLPAQRSLIESAHNQQFDGELARAANVEENFPNLIRVPVKLIELKANAFVLDQTIQIENWDKLSTYLFGTIRGYFQIEKRLKPHEYILVNHAHQGLELVRLGRLDVLVLPQKIGLDAMKKNDYPGVQMVEPAVADIGIYHYLHKKHSLLIPEVAKELSDLSGNPVDSFSKIGN